MLDIVDYNCIKCLVVIDKLNVKKTLLNKFNSLDNNGDKTALWESNLKLAILSSLCEIPLLISNSWTIEA